MPADSEAQPELPITWRPLGVRIVGIAGGFFLLAAFVSLWLLLPASVRADFDLFQKATALALGALGAATFWALVRSRVTATADRLIVVNGYKRREFEYAQVIAIRLNAGAPWAILDLADGTTCSVIAIQATDGPRSFAAVRTIRSLLG